MHSDQCTVMHWSLAAKGYLPWRHTSRWVSPEPEPPAPVIVTPEEEPEAVAPEISHWITDRPPTKVDADKDGDVEISTSSGLAVDWSYEKWFHVTLGRAWRHCSTWLPPEPEPSTPTAPEPEPEAAALESGDWITDRLPTKVDADKDGDVEISTSSGLAVDWSYEKWFHVTLGWAWRHCSTWLPPELEPSTPAAPEPEAEPKQATRGFLALSRVSHQDGFIDCAIGTDHTAFIRFSAVACLPGDWVPVRPLPQPGEE